jgi:hypothetical protein
MSFFRDNVSTSFYKKDWIESLKHKLFEMQQSKFLVTQSYIEKYNELHNKFKELKGEESRLSEIIEDIDIQRRGLFDEITKEQLVLYKETKKQMTSLKRRITVCSSLMLSMSHNKDWSPERHPQLVIDVTEESIDRITDLDLIIDLSSRKSDLSSDLDEKKETLIGVMPCCHGDCKGIVTCAVRRETSVTSNYKCGLCQSNYCKSCRVIKTSEEHTCDPHTVASVKLIKESAKPCPKCKTSITKIDGCDQMWCPQCKTAFSWKTGDIETGPIHNPHYYKFLRETQGHVPRAQGDNPYCPQNENELVYVRALFFERGSSNLSVAHKRILEIHRQLLHINQYRPKVIDLTADTIELRVLRMKYLMNKITKEDLCDRLIKIHNANVRTNEIAQVYEMVVRTVNDTLRNLSQAKVKPLDKYFDPLTDDLIDHCLQASVSVKRIVSIANEALEVIAKRWKTKVYRFDDMLKEVKSNAS